jgi:hypothetical protein
VPPVDAEHQYVTREILAWCLILLGAFFLAKSVVSKGKRWTMRDLLGVPTERLKAYRHVVAQRLEAWFGFLFVLSGVGIHLYILLRRYRDTKDVRHAYQDVLLYVGGTVAAMVVVAIVLHLVCKWVSRRSFVDLVSRLVVRHDVRIEDDQDLLKELGEILGVPHEDDDTVESYTERVERALRLDRERERERLKGTVPPSDGE